MDKKCFYSNIYAVQMHTFTRKVYRNFLKTLFICRRMVQIRFVCDDTNICTISQLQVATILLVQCTLKTI